MIDEEAGWINRKWSISPMDMVVWGRDGIGDVPPLRGLGGCEGRDWGLTAPARMWRRLCRLGRRVVRVGGNGRVPRMARAIRSAGRSAGCGACRRSGPSQSLRSGVGEEGLGGAGEFGAGSAAFGGVGGGAEAVAEGVGGGVEVVEGSQAAEAGFEGLEGGELALDGGVGEAGSDLAGGEVAGEGHGVEVAVVVEERGDEVVEVPHVKRSREAGWAFRGRGKMRFEI